MRRSVAAVRSCQPRPAHLLFRRLSSGRTSLLTLRSEAFGRLVDANDVGALLAARLVIIGEIHSVPQCVELQVRAASSMLGAMSADGPKLHLVMEHFNFEMQPHLDGFSRGDLSLSELATAAAEEGHTIEEYGPLLGICRENASRMVLHAGFIPRSYARLVMRESVDAALEAAKAANYVRGDETCAATEAHYGFFESLLTGRPISSDSPPSERFRAMFPAQVIKDAAMAHKVAQLISASDTSSTIGASSRATAHHADDRFLVICGIGHSGYSHGVPERIFRAHPSLAAAGRTYRVWCLPLPSTVDFDSPPALVEALSSVFGPAGTSSPAEACLAFAEAALPLERGSNESGAPQPTRVDGDGSVSRGAGMSADDRDTSTAEVAKAYGAVGETAYLSGDARRAVAIMQRLGYTEPQIAVAGADIHNFQGVGTPHRSVALQPGETVLDLGSGLGIDSFIAADAVGKSGTVLGIDLAHSQVKHAQARATARGLPSTHTRFVVGHLEHVPLPDASVDAVISNGAFCLAQDKRAAFGEVYRVLRPGGRFAICTSAMLQPLDDRAQWPLCMRMFADLASLEPTCTSVGLVDVVIDDTDSAMAFELPIEYWAPTDAAEQQGEVADTDAGAPKAEVAATVQRNSVHVGSPQFGHLANYDVNALCCRVVVTGRKPR